MTMRTGGGRGILIPSAPDATVTIENVPRKIRMFKITEDELDRLSAGYSSIDQLLLGIAAGGLFSSVIAFLTANLTGNALSIFSALLAVFVLASVYFGLRVRAGRNEARAHVERLKQH